MRRQPPAAAFACTAVPRRPPARRAQCARRRPRRPRACAAQVVDMAVSDDVSRDAGVGAGSRALARDAEALLRAALPRERAELSLLLCSDAAIARLNAAWRGKGGATDVLSFAQGGGAVLGDVVISVETAARQADERGYALRDELRVLLVHGLLHLLGYDHETSVAELDEMAAAEKTLLTRLGWLGTGLIAASIASVDDVHDKRQGDSGAQHAPESV